jgi:hypothetical protein
MKSLSFFIGLSLPIAGLAAPAAPDAAGAAWQLLANYRPDFALSQFERLAASNGPEARSARLGEALSLLAQPSPVMDRVGRARVILTALAAEGADDIALAAQFYLARLAEFSAEPADPELAAAEFRRLIAGHPESAWAQAAIARLAILLLYTPAGPADPAARLAAAEQLLAFARGPQAIVDLHLVIADAVFHYRLPDRLALPRLLAAERTGALDSATRGDVLVQIAELSRLEGDAAQARAYYDRFLAEYPRDARQFAVRQQLAVLDAAR